MKHEHPLPDDSRQTDLSVNMQQRLQRLQPRCVSFDAESVLSAAREADQFVCLPGPSQDGRLRPGRWVVAASMFACGVFVGAWISWFVAAGRSGGDLHSKGLDESSPLERVASPDHELPADATDEPESKKQSRPRWSRRDLLVSDQLQAVHRPQSRRAPPLTAGDAVLHGMSPSRRNEQLAVGEPTWLMDPPQAGAAQPSDERPTRSLDRRRLLDELLGVDPGPRL